MPRFLTIFAIALLSLFLLAPEHRRRGAVGLADTAAFMAAVTVAAGVWAGTARVGVGTDRAGGITHIGEITTDTERRHPGMGKLRLQAPGKTRWCMSMGATRARSAS